MEAIAERSGYRVSWTPPASFHDGDSELVFDLEFVIAHLIIQKEDIFFLQIGANDGRCNDPLHKFVTRFGWRGILIEPQPHVFSLLQQTYANNTRVTLVNAAISEHDEKRTLYTIREDGASFDKAHQFSSFVRAALLRQTAWVPDVAARIQETTVDCFSLSGLLDKFARDQSVDIIVTDTEGYDFNILQMIDFNRMRPSIICYEHAHMTKSEQNAAARLMQSHGYRLGRTNLDTIAYAPSQTFGFRLDPVIAP
jgi:FkbM family methyltransferase